MKKLIPFILSYLLIAGGTAAFSHFVTRTDTRPYPPNSVTIVTTLSHDELAAKLQQAGLPEAGKPLQMLTMSSAPILSLFFHFGYYAVILAAFTGLTFLFQRKFEAESGRHDVAA
ncbi:MAG: hypothetical protein ACLQSR_08975 [Limisphaerales bacterium]